MSKQTIKEKISKTLNVLDISKEQGQLSGLTRMESVGQKALETRLKRGVFQRGETTGKKAFPNENKTGFENRFVNGVFQNETIEETEEDREATPDEVERKQIDVSEAILENNKSHIEDNKQLYRDLEFDKIKTVESLDSGAWRVGASLAGNMAKEFNDIVSLSEQIATASLVTAATGGIGAGAMVVSGVKPLATAGASKWGAYFASKGLEHVADAAISVYDDKERQEFFGMETPNKEEMATQFASGVAVSVLGDAVLHGAGKLLRSYKGNLNNWNSAKATPSGNYRSVKDVVVQAVNDGAGTPHYHETRAFLKGVTKDTVDPRNPHIDGSDAIMDLVDPNKVYINNDVHRPVDLRSVQLDELEFNKSRMSPEDYAIQKTEIVKNIKNKLETNQDVNVIMDIPRLPIVSFADQIRMLDFDKTNKVVSDDYQIQKDLLLNNTGINLAGTSEPNFSAIENYNDVLATLKEHAKSGSFALFSDGDNSTSITKEIDGSVTKMTIKNDQISWFNKNNPNSRKKSYQENTLNNIVKYGRIEVIQPNGDVKTITGEKKMFHFFDGKFKQKTKDLLDIVIMQSERQQSLINEYGKGKTHSNLENQTFVDGLFSQVRGVKEQITSTTASVFEDSLGLKYDTVGHFLHDCREGFGLSVVKDKPVLNFRKTTDIIGKTSAAETFINHLVEQDTFSQSIQTKIGTELEMLPTEFPDIFNLQDGSLSFNEKGLFKNGVVETLLDLAVNPNMIDTPDYFKKYGENLVDSNILNKVVLPYVGYDRIDAMAIEKVFDNDQHINILKQLGMLGEDDLRGVNIASQKEVLSGLTNLMKNYISDDPVYDKTAIKEIFDGFKDFSKLPQRYDTPRDRTAKVGPVSTNLYDFIFSNRSSGMMSKSEINESLAPITGMLKTEIKTATDILVKESKRGSETAQVSKATIDISNKASAILNRMNKMLKSGKTNEYLAGDRFRKDKRELINLKGFLDLDNENLVDYKKILDLKPKKYEGDLQAENLTNFLKENLKVKTLNVEAENKLISILDDWDKRFSSAYIKKHVQTKKFANTKNELVNYLENIQANKELVTTLKNLDPTKYSKEDKKVYLDSIKAVREHVAGMSEKSKKLTVGIDSLLSSLEKKDPSKVIKYKKFIKQADMVLENAPESEAKRSLKDFLDYTNNKGEYSISAKELEGNIENAMKELSIVSGEAPAKELTERAKNFKDIGKLYNKLGNSLRETKTDNTIKFFSNSDIKETYGKIVDLNKKLGNPFKSLEPLVNIMDSVKNVTDRFAESKANSPLQRRQKNFAIKFPRLTSEQTKIMKRAEFVMNKKRLLADKQYFNKTPEEIVKVIHTYDSVADIKDAINSKIINEGDIVKEFVNPKYIEEFDKCYEFASPLMDQIADTLEDGTIGLRDVNKDEFALAYAQVLDEVTKTTQIMNKVNIKDYKNLSEIQPYFKDFDNMLEFLCGREDYNRPKGEIMYSLIDKNAAVLAEHWTLGTSMSTFASRMDVNNSTVKNLLDLNKVSSVIDGKVVTKEFPTVLQGNMQAIQERLTTLANPKSNVGENKFTGDSNIAKFFAKFFDVSTSIYMIATGGKEIVAKPYIVNSRINRLEDFSGQYGTFAKSQYKALAQGITTGVSSIPEVVTKCAAGTWNTVAELDRYFGVQKALNTYTNADLDLRIQKNMDLNAWLSVPKTQKGNYIKTAMNRYMSNDQFRKIKDQSFADPSDKFASFADYTKEGFSAAIQQSHLQINNAQELASSIAYVNSSAASLGQLDMISKKAYNELSGNQLHNLRVAGIKEENFDLFKKVYSKFSDENGILADVDSVNVAEHELNFAEMDMFDKIKGTYHAIRDLGFDENKEAKYSQDKFANIWYKIMGKFRKTTVGVALEDVRNLLNVRTEYGTLENRFSANMKGRDFKDATKYLTQYSGSALNAAIILTAAGQLGNIVNRFMKADVKQGRKDLAEEIGDADAIINSVRDKSFKKTASLFCSTYTNNAYQNSAVGVFFSEGNILRGIGSSAKQAIVDTNTIAMQQGMSKESLDSFWASFGLKGVTEDVGYLDAPENRHKILAIGHTLAKMSQLRYAVNVLDSKKYIQGDYDEEKEQKSFAQYHLSGLSDYERKQAFAKLSTQKKLPALRPEDVSPEEKAEMKKLLDDPETLYKNVGNTLKSLMNLKKDQMDILQSGINESLHKNNLKDDDEYISDKIQVMKDMDLDGKISELPNIYRLAIGNILDEYTPKNELDLLETKESILRDVSNDMGIRDLKNKYVSDVKKRKVTTLPIIYRMLEKDLKKKGFYVKQGEMLEYAKQGLNINEIRDAYIEKSKKVMNPDIAITDVSTAGLNILNDDLDGELQAPIEATEDGRILNEKLNLEQKIKISENESDKEGTSPEISDLEKELQSPIKEDEKPKESILKKGTEQLKENVKMNVGIGKEIGTDTMKNIKTLKDNASTLLSKVKEFKDGNKNMTKEQMIDLFNNIQELSNTASSLDKISQAPTKEDEVIQAPKPPVGLELNFDKIKNTVGGLIEVAKDGIREFAENEKSLAERTGDSTKESFETAKKMTELTLEEVAKSYDTFTPDDAEPVFEVDLNNINNILKDISDKSQALTGSLDDIFEKFNIDKEVPEQETAETEPTKATVEEPMKEVKEDKEETVPANKPSIKQDILAPQKAIIQPQIKKDQKQVELLKAQRDVSAVLRKKSNVVPDVIADKVLDKNNLPPLVAAMLSEKEAYQTKSGDERVMYYHKQAGTKHANANTSWCAAFVTTMLENSGHKFKPNEKTSVAQQIYRYRDKDNVRKNAGEAQVGDIVIFRNRTAHRTKRSWSGHVNVVAAVGEDYILCIGGNQDNGAGKERVGTINFKVYNKSRATKAMNQRDLPTPDMSIFKVRDNK